MVYRREYPEMPLVGVGAVVLIDNKVLLVKRKNPPCKNCWSVPGGLVEVDEFAKEAVIRELREETGIEGEVIKLLDVFDIIIRDEFGNVRYHYVILDFLVRPLSSSVKPGSDALDAKFFGIDEALEEKLTNSTRFLLEKLKKGDIDIIESELSTLEFFD